jgi:branched-chain amino acid aminotransferase
MKSDYIWMDGTLVPFADAKIHLHSPSLHYGPGVFEGVRCYDTSHGPATFRLWEHMVRFTRSIHVLGFESPYSVEELCDAVHQTSLANRFRACYIRPLMYLEGPLALNLNETFPHVSVSTWEWGTLLGKDALEKGATAIVSSFTRMHPNSSMTKAKITGQYVNSMLAKSIAQKVGVKEAILLDAEGFVAECSGENIFLVRDGKIFTPPKATILEGITRECVITLAD